MKQTTLFNGRRLNYYSEGPSAEAVPLVLLHGFCEDSGLWAPLKPFLSGIRIVRVDLPGFGSSDVPLVPGMDMYADAVCAVLNELDIARCVLVGHSMGGYAALAFARQYPERLAGLGLFHSHPFADEPERRENRQRGIDLLRAGRKNQYVGQLFPGLFAPDFARAHPDVVDALIRRGRRQSTAGIVAALEGMKERPARLDTLEALTCPVLWVLGECDSIVPPDQALKAALLPAISAVQLLPRIGHMGMYEASEPSARILKEFRQFCIS